MTTEIRFYHLLHSTLENALPRLTLAAYKKGHRVLIKVPDASSCAHLNDALWSFSPESFLPHGPEEETPEHQPVLLSHSGENKNNADVLILTHDAQIDNMSDYALCCDIFDGGDASQLKMARERWKKWKADDAVKISYYQQSSNGAWEQKA